MKIHILGICGTFMGSLAILARDLGYQVSGQDAKVYPPMSTQLLEHGIQITDGFEIADMPRDCDLIVIGNVMKRGMPVIEYVLNNKLRYVSGPEFLAEHVLKNQHVLVVTGTHGKTTTTSILAWILEQAGLQPGFLIGGVPNNFGISGRLGAGKYFVIEGDEYDCAFFDKRSKFLHYKPQTLILNNIEYDHADIFPNLEAILQQFHHLLRIVPSNGLIVQRADDLNVQTVLERGCWTPTTDFALTNATWNTGNLGATPLPFSLLGPHNKMNALAAMAAANNLGVDPSVSLAALHKFTGVKRRLEIKGETNGVTIYSDFAHHPTAIATTIKGLRELIGEQARIIAVVDICSNTMKAGVHQESLIEALEATQQIYFHHATSLTWNLHRVWASSNKIGGVFDSVDALLQAVIPNLKPGDNVLLMSNGAFEEFAPKLLNSVAMDVA
jgi:UDP-N-acetylmuramate: L-alanyl-gamma-D-glutamyl-meso-diaminopimelate ligase